MATLDKTYSGYSTYILGTTKNLVECSEIVLYNRLEISTEKISLYNLEKVYNDVISKKKFIRLTRDTFEDSFIYNSNNGTINGFNVIIYINKSDDSLIGYTEFLSNQGKDRNINIFLNFTSKIDGNLELVLTNSLSQLRNNTTVKKEFIGDELYNYTGSDKIKEDILGDEDKFPRYTNHLTSSLYEKTYNRNIFLDFAIINKDKFIKLNINKNINIDPHELGFSKYQIGYFSGDIVIYSWQDNKYSIYSLTKNNKFGNPITYTPSDTGYRIISENKNLTISYFSGKYAVIEDSVEDEFLLFNIEKEKIIDETYSKFLLDEWDPKENIIELPKILNYNNVINYIPDITNIYLNLEEYSKTNSINLVKKVGEWYVLKQKRINEDSLIIYTNLSKTIYTREDEEVFILNDKTLMIYSNPGEEKVSYYTIYSENGTYYSENARKIVEKGEISFDEELGIMFCSGINDRDYKDYYQNNMILIAFLNDSIVNSYFNKFRRNVIPYDLSIPKIIGCISGILFYKQNNSINYL